MNERWETLSTIPLKGGMVEDGVEEFTSEHGEHEKGLTIEINQIVQQLFSGASHGLSKNDLRSPVTARLDAE